MLEELRIALGAAGGILALYALAAFAARRVKKPWSKSMRGKTHMAVGRVALALITAHACIAVTTAALEGGMSMAMAATIATGSAALALGVAAFAAYRRRKGNKNWMHVHATLGTSMVCLGIVHIVINSTLL